MLDLIPNRELYWKLNYAKAELIEPHSVNLLSIDQLANYAENVCNIMGNYNITFPVLAIIEEQEYGRGYDRQPHIMRAVWKQVSCHGFSDEDGRPSLVIGDGAIFMNEYTIGYLTMDTSWEDIKEVFNELGIYPCWDD